MSQVVEIVGPAGAGKSTLYHALAGAGQCVHPGNFPDVRNAADSPFFIWYGLQVIPTVLRLSERDSRQLTRPEFAWLTILKGWSTVLQKQSKAQDGVILLDQGPVYLLTELREFGPEYLSRPPGEPTWQALYSSWARTLNAIIWLDAPNACLLERIRSREKDHVVKSEDSDTVSEFLDHYRTAYERTMSRLAGGSTGVQILRFDTSKETPEQISKHLLSTFGLVK